MSMRKNQTVWIPSFMGHDMKGTYERCQGRGKSRRYQIRLEDGYCVFVKPEAVRKSSND